MAVPAEGVHHGTMPSRVAPTPALAVSALFALGFADLTWQLTRHSVMQGCGDIDRYSPAAPYGAVVAGILAVASVVMVAVDRSADRRDRLVWRRITLAVSTFTILAVGVSLLAMFLDSTFQICF